MLIVSLRFDPQAKAEALAFGWLTGRRRTGNTAAASLIGETTFCGLTGPNDDKREGNRLGARRPWPDAKSATRQKAKGFLL